MEPKPFGLSFRSHSAERAESRRTSRELIAHSRQLAFEADAVRAAAAESCQRARRLIIESEELRRSRRRG